MQVHLFVVFIAFTLHHAFGPNVSITLRNVVLPNARKALIISAFPTPPKTVQYHVKASFTKAAAMSVLTHDTIPATSNGRKPMPF
jgi:hypothetical protein